MYVQYDIIFQTFDECVEQDGNDCDPENLWVQIPFFCGHTFKCRFVL